MLRSRKSLPRGAFLFLNGSAGLGVEEDCAVAAAHETGYVLAIPTLFLEDMDHDFGPFPDNTELLMKTGAPVDGELSTMPGRWIRHKDWEAATSVELTVSDASKISIMNGDTEILGPVSSSSWEQDLSATSLPDDDLSLTVTGVETGQVTIAALFKDDEGAEICRDTVVATMLTVELTACRPQTEGPGYGSPFQKHEIPDNKEESPGAGIRVNGDSEAAIAENDLIEVELEVAPFPVPFGVAYALKRNNSNIKVWDSCDMTGLCLLDTAEEEITISSSPMSVWVENPNGGSADFELVAKDVAGNDACGDKIHFYPFTSVVIVFEGENGTPSDPPEGGMSQLALSIYTNGYDVHLYDEPDIHENHNGEEDALLEIANAKGNRQVSQIAIMGYSHGGGSTYNVADELNGTITMSAYIDAVSQPLVNMSQETRLPPGTQYHLNYYQVGVGLPLNDPFFDLGIDGGPVVGAVNVNLDLHGQVETHITIDDNPTVLNGIRSVLLQRVSK